MGLVVALVLIGGCVSPPFQHDRELEDLLAAYRKQTALSTEREARRQAQGIRTLRVEQREDTGEWLVSADLDRAALGTVVSRLLDATKTAHLIRVPAMRGPITARLDRLPLQRALGLFLQPVGLFAWDEQGVLIIGDEPPSGIATTGGSTEPLEAPHPPPPAPPLAPSSETAPSAPAAEDTAGAPAPPEHGAVARAVSLRHLDVETAGKIFESIYPVDAQTGTRAVLVASEPSTSTLLLSGAAPAVARATRILGEMDREPAHVMLEVLVVEFDTNELERLGTSLSGFQNRQYRDLATAIGSSDGTAALTFSYVQGANLPLMFRAMIDVLSSQDKARIIARPYTAALSGRKASVKIARSRDIQQPFRADGATGTISPPPPVTRETGVFLEVTPWVLADDRIRLELNVEESVFIDDLATNVIAETDKNTAATTMMVESGQSIIIGGLAVQRKSAGNAGLPWLRHVPLLNLATAQQTAAEQKQNVIIYITPYLVGAGIDPPFPNPEAFKFRDRRDDTTRIERLEGGFFWKRDTPGDPQP